MRRVAAIAAFIMLAASAASLQTGVSEDEIIDFMGWREGATWDYSCRDIDGARYREQWRVESVKIFSRGSAALVKKFRNGAEHSEAAYLIAAPMVYESYDGDEAFWLVEIEGFERNDSSFLKFPLVRGAEWGGPLEIPEGKVIYAGRTVRTPAGVFRKCVGVKIQFEDGHTVYTICPGAGIVKVEGYIAGYKGKETMTLTGYRIPEKP